MAPALTAALSAPLYISVEDGHRGIGFATIPAEKFATLFYESNPDPTG